MNKLWDKNQSEIMLIYNALKVAGVQGQQVNNPYALKCYKGLVIIYGYPGGIAIFRIRHTEILPTLDVGALKFCPPPSSTLYQLA